MACSTCKKKKKNTPKGNKVTFENVEKNNKEKSLEKTSIGEDVFKGLGDIIPQNVGIKIITFCGLLVAVPLFTVYLLGYIFTMFFFTKNSKGNGISLKGLFMFFTYPTRKWKSFRGKIRERAKQREFAKTISYDDMDGIDIFVSDKKKEDIKIAEEELKDVELVLVDEKDNNNG
jgi:hypothetical protein